MAVAVGDYDAGAVCADFEEEENPSKLIRQLRVIALTDPAPGWLMTIRRDLPAKDKETLIKAILALSPGSSLSKKVLSMSPWHGFAKPKGNELEKIEELIHKYNIPESI